MLPGTRRPSRRVIFLLVSAVFIFLFYLWEIQIDLKAVLHSRQTFDEDARSVPEGSSGHIHSKASKTRKRPSPVELALDTSWRSGFRNMEIDQYYDKIIQSCISGDGCTRNHDKVVILAWYHFSRMMDGGSAGENVWCDSIVDALHGLGYSLLIAWHGRTVEDLWRQYHKNVVAVLWDPAECMRQYDCVWIDPEIEDPPPPTSTHLNIPLWKIFAFHWWAHAVHPLGGAWTLSPENYTIWGDRTWAKDNLYLGYSVESSCQHTEYVPWDERPRQAYIMAKYLDFFLKPDYVLMEDGVPSEQHLFSDFYQKVSEEVNVTFVGRFYHDIPDAKPPPGIVELPELSRPVWQATVAKSRLLMGISSPALSPSPWEALCLGVPFINPIRSWDENDPDNRMKWEAQHNGLVGLGLDEPYVYHVRVGDKEGVKRAIIKAMDTPLERFVPPEMRMSALMERLRNILEQDWRQKALKMPRYRFGDWE